MSFKHETEISLITLKLSHNDCHSLLSSFIYLLNRERERERERDKTTDFRVLCSVKWLELAPFEHDFFMFMFFLLYV